MKLKCYVAGPYSVPDPVANVAKACKFAGWLLDRGYNVFVPHLNMLLHMMEQRSWDDWLNIDLEWLEKCDCLIRLPGESKGSDLEVAAAKERHIPYYALSGDSERERSNLLHWLADVDASRKARSK